MGEWLRDCEQEEQRSLKMSDHVEKDRPTEVVAMLKFNDDSSRRGFLDTLSQKEEHREKLIAGEGLISLGTWRFNVFLRIIKIRPTPQQVSGNRKETISGSR